MNVKYHMVSIETIYYKREDTIASVVENLNICTNLSDIYIYMRTHIYSEADITFKYMHKKYTTFEVILLVTFRYSIHSYP